MELAKNNIGSICRCEYKKIVNIYLKGVSLHFDDEAFLLFSSMLEEAASKAMDINLKYLTEK